MGNHPGSSPGNRTTIYNGTQLSVPFFLFSLVIYGGAVTGTVQRMEYRLVPILHPLHAIADMILPSDKVFCAIAERQVQVYKRGESLSFFIFAVIERGLPRS